MAISRREALVWAGKFAAVTVVAKATGCKAHETEEPPSFLKISKLNDNLEQLEGKVVQTRGFPEHLGRETLLLPGIGLEITFAERTIDSYRFYEEKIGESESILIVKEASAIWSLLPFNFAPARQYDGKELIITGRVKFGVVRGEEETYFLEIQDVTEIE